MIFYRSWSLKTWVASHPNVNIDLSLKPIWARCERIMKVIKRIDVDKSFNSLAKWPNWIHESAPLPSSSEEVHLLQSRSQHSGFTAADGRFHPPAAGASSSCSADQNKLWLGAFPAREVKPSPAENCRFHDICCYNLSCQPVCCPHLLPCSAPHWVICHEGNHSSNLPRR